MARQLETHDPDLPAPAEAIHLPEPSYLPAVLALGVMLGLVGIVIQPLLSVIGVILAVVAVVRWIGQTRREMAELPLEHH